MMIPLTPVRITQKGVDVSCAVTDDGWRALVQLRADQTDYLARAWAIGKDVVFKENLPARTRAHLRLLSVYARSHGKPVPEVEGILVPKGQWKGIVGGVLINGTIPILFAGPVPAMTSKGIRVLL